MKIEKVSKEEANKNVIRYGRRTTDVSLAVSACMELKDGDALKVPIDSLNVQKKTFQMGVRAALREKGIKARVLTSSDLKSVYIVKIT